MKLIFAIISLLIIQNSLSSKFQNSNAFSGKFKSIEEKIHFTIYCDAHTKAETPLLSNDTNQIRHTCFDPNLPTVIITHGWSVQKCGIPCTVPRDAHLKKGGQNIIVADWSELGNWSYMSAVDLVKPVSEVIAKFIDSLHSIGLNCTNLKILGHSLGGHIAGLAARYAKCDVGYILGLEPALPYFVFAEPGSRISTSDGNFVEVIHTNAGVWGMLSPIGHADFYVNGGSTQPHCRWSLGHCSHMQALYYYGESVNSELGFYGRRCENNVEFLSQSCHGPIEEMGSARFKPALQGSFAVLTRNETPYALGKPRDGYLTSGNNRITVSNKLLKFL